jgi:hypothetical protein
MAGQEGKTAAAYVSSIPAENASLLVPPPFPQYEPADHHRNSLTPQSSDPPLFSVLILTFDLVR